MVVRLLFFIQSVTLSCLLTYTIFNRFKINDMKTTNEPSLRSASLGAGAKTLILVRHAKSSWDNEGLPDFERPLNKRGKEDAPKMAKGLMERKIDIDAFISSPAKRAKKTAELFMEEFEVKKSKLILVPALYLASVEAFYQTIHEVDDTLKSIALFSHNPGITYFANGLIDDVRLDDMPTCSIFAVKVLGNAWSAFKDAEKEFLFFDYPKKESA